MPRFTDVTVFHGFAMRPDRMWFPWLRKELEKRGFSVNIPAFPKPFTPDEKAWTKAAMPVVQHWHPGTLVIGHSVGGTLATRLLAAGASKKGIGGLITIGSPFTSTFNVAKYVKFFAKPMNWERLMATAPVREVLHSKDDPIVSYDHGVRYAEAMRAGLHVVSKGGHFTGANCPRLLRIVDEVTVR
jgi:predicted alpha/beta hydrolase family esterase